MALLLRMATSATVRCEDFGQVLDRRQAHQTEHPIAVVRITGRAAHAAILPLANQGQQENNDGTFRI